MTRSILAFFALILLTSPLIAQSLEYKVDLTDSKSKRVKVTVTTKKLGAETATYQMPAWAPGAYSVTNYGRYVQEFKAYDMQGKELATTRLNQNRWSIPGAKSLGKLEYFIADSRKDSTSLWFAMAHIDSNLFFANATALFGYVNDKKHVPATVTYVKPADWELGTALNYSNAKLKRDCAFAQTTFKASDYDELVDAPVLAAPSFQTRCFEQDGAHYEIALVSNRDFPMDSLELYTKKIVKVQTDFFSETPFKHYTFLYFVPTFMQMPSLGQGALEHMNSSAYLLMHQPWTQFKEGGLRIISHEFFHLWNVKRIHSTLLGPFDYTKGVHTSSLWLSEGVTDYYAHALLARNGLLTPEKFLSDVRDWYTNYRTSKVAREKSLEQISLEESEFDLPTAIVLYTKGPLVGLMLDAEIRTRTNDRKSLDDVMIALNNDAKRGKHFTDAELMGKVSRIVGLDLSEFHRKYIAGADSIDLETVLNTIGLTSAFDLTTELKAKGDQVKVELQFTSAGNPVIVQLPVTSFFAQAGFQVGDTVLSLNGSPLNANNIETSLSNIDRDKAQIVLVRREGEEHTLRFTPNVLIQQRTRTRPLPFRQMDTATPLQIAVRTSIMGSME